MVLKTHKFLSKIITLFLLGIFLITTGFGCKGLSATQQQATQPVALEFWTVNDDVDALQKLFAEYTAARPYITVNIRQYTYDEIYQRLTEALAEDKGPDIISVYNRRLREFQSKLAPMPAGINDTTVVVTKSQLGTNVAVNTAPRAMVTAAQLDAEFVKAVKSDVVMDGQIYGLPLSMDMMALYYNKDLLDRAGVAEPPKTWDEFQADVKKITKFDKATDKITQSGAALGTGNVPASDDLIYLLFKQSNLNFSSKEGQAVFNFAGAPGLQVMDFYTDFANPIKDTYAWSNDNGSALDAFVNGSVGFYFGYNYDYNTIAARNPQLDFRVMPMLQLNASAPVNAASYWVQSVTSKSKHQNEAWGLVDFMARSKFTKNYLDTTNRPTALRAFIADQRNSPVLAPFVSQVLTADSWYRGRNYEAAKKAVRDMLDEWILPVPADKVDENHQQILNRAAAQVNQSI